MELVKQEWYQSLIDDIDSARVEGVYNYHWTLIETYHLIGRRILSDKENFGALSLEQVLQRLARDMGRGKRMMRYGVKLYERFPDLKDLPEGKDITMNKIIQKYLTGSTKIAKPAPVYSCPKCGHEDGSDAFRS